MNNKGADQSACMLVCAFVVRKPPKYMFSRVEAHAVALLETLEVKRNVESDAFHMN